MISFYKSVIHEIIKEASKTSGTKRLEAVNSYMEKMNPTDQEKFREKIRATSVQGTAFVNESHELSSLRSQWNKLREGHPQRGALAAQFKQIGGQNLVSISNSALGNKLRGVHDLQVPPASPNVSNYFTNYPDVARHYAATGIGGVGRGYIYSIRGHEFGPLIDRIPHVVKGERPLLDMAEEHFRVEKNDPHYKMTAGDFGYLLENDTNFQKRVEERTARAYNFKGEPQDYQTEARLKENHGRYINGAQKVVAGNIQKYKIWGPKANPEKILGGIARMDKLHDMILGISKIRKG